MLFEKALPIDSGNPTSTDQDYLQFYNDLCAITKELYQRKQSLRHDRILEHARLNHQLQLCYYRLLKFNCDLGWSTSDRELIAAVEYANLDHFVVPSNDRIHNICCCNQRQAENLAKASDMVSILTNKDHRRVMTECEADGRDSPVVEDRRHTEEDPKQGRGYSYTEEEYSEETCFECGDFCMCGAEIKIYECSTQKTPSGLEELSDPDMGLEFSPEIGIHLPVPVQPVLNPDEIGDDLPDTIMSGPERINHPERCIGAVLSLKHNEVGKQVQRRLTRRRFRGVVGRDTQTKDLTILDRSRRVVYSGRPNTATSMFQQIRRNRDDNNQEQQMQLRDVEELLGIYLWWQERYDDVTSTESLFSAALANIPIDWDKLMTMAGSAHL